MCVPFAYGIVSSTAQFCRYFARAQNEKGGQEGPGDFRVQSLTSEEIFIFDLLGVAGRCPTVRSYKHRSNSAKYCACGCY